MKYLHGFKGFIFIALACSVTAQGSTFISDASKNDPQGNQVSTVYNISVSSGQAHHERSSANLTISGENSKVSLEKEGTVSLTAGESIILRPGTKISSGSFLYACIEPRAKSGKSQGKVVKLVTIEENREIEEQASLAFACSLFTPFPAISHGHLHAGDAENGSFTSSTNELSGVTPEQQRKVAIDSRQLSQVARKQMFIENNPLPVAYAYRPEAMRVLRL